MINATSPSGLPYFACDGGGEPVGADPASLHVIGGQKGGEGLRIGSGVNTYNFDLLGGLVDRLAERSELGRRDDDCRWFAGDGVLKDRDLAIDIGFGLSAELGHGDVEFLACFAGTGENDLPEAEVVSLTMIGMVGFGSAAGAFSTHTGYGDGCKQSDNFAQV